MRVFAIIASIVALLGTGAGAQTFNSGSTGVDGMLAPAANLTITLPESGMLHYTTINIPAGVTVAFARNSRNTAVTILASGDVTVAGTISLDGKNGSQNGLGGAGGPGGFAGGFGGFSFDAAPGTAGDGPGGGGGGRGLSTSSAGGGGGAGFAQPGAAGQGQSPGLGGPRYGSGSLIPLSGGSGGGGGGAGAAVNGSGGGGGGGAILLASSGTIRFLSGTIRAQGGSGLGVGTSAGAGGGGSGGAIRIVATAVTGNATLNVLAGNGGGGVAGGNGAVGYLRMEAHNTGGFVAATFSTPLSSALPNPAVVTNAPILRIVSVAGITPADPPVGSLAGAPDLVVAASQANPVDVVIEASNLPPGTAVKITVTTAGGQRSSFTSSALAGTQARSSAVAGVILPRGASTLTASATVDLQE